MKPAMRHFLRSIQQAALASLLSGFFSFAAWGQSTVINSDAELVFTGLISNGACAPLVPKGTITNPYVVNLPSINTTQLKDSSFGPITTIELSLSNPSNAPVCTTLAGQPVKLIFDSALASITPRTGLLRNASTTRAANNVFVQLGLVSSNGSFTPIDLNQPQTLNQALGLNDKDPNKNTIGTLTLGIRYVAAPSVLAQSAGLRNTSTANDEVSAGNVSVYLPFLMKLN